MARFAAAMVLLSAILWFASRPPIPLGPDFPNCVSGKLETPLFVAGALSINGKNCMFVDRWYVDRRGTSVWSERSDGHFCGFAVSPYGRAEEPRGAAIVLDATTVAFHLPYFLITAIWIAVMLKCRNGYQFRITELMLGMTVASCSVWLIRERLALPLVVLLNLATSVLLAVLVVGGVCRLWTAANPLWPLLVAKRVQQE